MIICHRFYSTGWWAHLGKHISTELTEDTFDKVVTLKVSHFQHVLRFLPTISLPRPVTASSSRQPPWSQRPTRFLPILAACPYTTPQRSHLEKAGPSTRNRRKIAGRFWTKARGGYRQSAAGVSFATTFLLGHAYRGSKQFWLRRPVKQQWLRCCTSREQFGIGSKHVAQRWISAEPAESSSGWGAVKTSNDGWGETGLPGGWGGASGETDVPPGTSSSGRTEFWDPEQEASRPVTQEGDRVQMKNGLPTPVDSFTNSTPVHGTPSTSNMSVERSASRQKDEGERKREVEHLGRGYMAVKTRRRVTVDGGRSLLATESTNKEPQSQGKLGDNLEPNCH